MHIERRGKYEGVKVHLDADECKQFAALGQSNLQFGKPQQVVLSLASKIAKQLKEDPAILKPRTEDEIKAELITERDKAIEKLAKLEAGKKWNSK